MLSLYRLPNQLPNEKIVKVLRRDFFILLKKIAITVILLLIPLFFLYLLLLLNPDIFQNRAAIPLLTLGLSAYYLFVWLFFFFIFIDYYLDAWIITSERIIDIQQNGFFSRVIAEQKLVRVQDVTSEVNGFFPTVLKYGNVYVQTAGTKERFFFHQVPNPDQVRDMIIKLAQIKISEIPELKHPEQSRNIKPIT